MLTDIVITLSIQPFVVKGNTISGNLQVPNLFPLSIVLDTAAGVWCDTKSVVTSPRTGRYSADAAGGDASVELTRRCRHAAVAVGDLIFIYGGLRGGKIAFYSTICVPHFF